MKYRFLTAMIAVAAASPALAAGGMTCRTGGAAPVQVDLTYGHVFGTPLVASRLLVSGRTVPVAHPQWWLDRSEVRLVLTKPDAGGEELRLVARRAGNAYDGSVWRAGKRRWVRCRET